MKRGTLCMEPQACGIMALESNFRLSSHGILVVAIWKFDAPFNGRYHHSPTCLSESLLTRRFLSTPWVVLEMSEVFISNAKVTICLRVRFHFREKIPKSFCFLGIEDKIRQFLRVFLFGIFQKTWTRTIPGEPTFHSDCSLFHSISCNFATTFHVPLEIYIQSAH